MNLRVLQRAPMRALREHLERLDYSDAGLVRACGTAAPPGRAGLVPFLHATRDVGGLALLARAFLAGRSIAREATAKVWPDALTRLMQDAGLLALEGADLVPQAVLLPFRGLLFASDAFRLLDTPDARDFVLPANTHASRYLLDLTFRDAVKNTLDLGTGCGVQALFAAAHSEHVVATDLNPRAVRYAQFNAALNDLGNIGCRQGDLFAPVAGDTFDLIVSNPPFVPAPGRRYTYRETGMELDGLTRRVIREAPAHLRDNGRLEIIAEWVEIEGEPWQERVSQWLQGLGCDAWILRSPSQDPRAYAALRLGEVSGPAPVAGEEYAAWLDYFARHRVKAIHPGTIVLRRRRGRNWLQIQPVAREVRGAAGATIAGNIRACDFLAEHTRMEHLLDVVLTPAPDLAIEQSHRWTEEGAWQAAGIRAWLTGALPFDVELDPAAAALLRGFDGRATVIEALERFAELIGDDVPEVRRRCAPVLRLFLERGLLRPPG